MMSQMLSKADKVQGTDSQNKDFTSHISIFPATQRPKGDEPRLGTTIAPSDEEKCRKFARNKYRYILTV